MFISRFPFRCTLFALRRAPLSATYLLMIAVDEEMSSFTVLRERGLDPTHQLTIFRLHLGVSYTTGGNVQNHAWVKTGD